jgi:hypothetical protein
MKEEATNATSNFTTHPHVAGNNRRTTAGNRPFPKS